MTLNGVESRWKEHIVAYFSVLTRIRLERLSKAMKIIGAEIRRRYLPNAKQDC